MITSRRPGVCSKTVRPLLCLAVALACVLLTCGEAYAQAGTLVYIPQSGDNNVHVYGMNSDGTLADLTTIGIPGGNPQNVVMRGDQAVAYVTQLTSDRVSVIDTRTEAVVQTLTGFSFPVGLAIKPDGTRVYVANNLSGANTVEVFTADPITGVLTALTTIATGAGTRPRDLAISPDGTRLYVVCQASNELRIYDTSDNSLTQTVGVASIPFGVAVNAAGTRVYVANFASANVSVIDTTAGNSVIASPVTDAGPQQIAIRPDGTAFYTVNSIAGSISQFNASTNTAIAPVITGLSNTGGIGPAGTALYATNSSPNVVSMFTIASDGALTANGTIPGGNGEFWFRVCEKGNGLLATGGTFVANTAAALNCTGASNPTFTAGTLRINNNGLTVTNALTLSTGSGTIDTNGNDAAFSGGISGTGALTKTGAGTLTLSGTNNYSGATALSTGTLAGGAASGLPSSSTVTVDSGATLSTGGFTQTIGSLAGSGTVSLGAATLTAGGNRASTTFSGAITGTGGLTKSGAGALTLEGTHNYSGATTVSAGTLLLNGTLTSSPVVVASGATLAGSGTASAGVSVGSGGVLSPATTVGVIFTGNLTMANGSTLLMQLNGPIAGTQADRVIVIGGVSLGSSNLSVSLGYTPTLALMPFGNSGVHVRPV